MDLLEELRINGVAELPTRINALAVREHLDQFPVFNAHVRAKATAQGKLATAPWPMFCHEMEAAVTAPGLFETALQMLPIADEYFGEPALMYSMNAFWTQPAPGAPLYADTHDWHRDGDDRKQLVMFAFGTDVALREDGAHLYQRGSHLIRDEAGLMHPNMNPREDTVIAVTGTAGKVFLTDPWGLHMAPRPQKRRLLLWARFGVSCPPEAYRWDKLVPVSRARIGDRYPQDPDPQRAIRLVVE
jgi:Phytanoyl-CoA dioxygenase (PhyH)